MGCRLQVVRKVGGWARVELPDSVRGWVKGAALRQGKLRAPGAADILKSARLFQGAPYLWGGVSPKGADCSGLVQTVFGVHGIPLPRDVAQQRSAGDAIAKDRIVAGDLLFFGPSRARLDHVGIAAGGGGFIHAGCPIGEGNLDPDSPRFERRLARRYRIARRILRPV